MSPLEVLPNGKVKCQCCNICIEDPRRKGRCIYGGPFEFVDVTTPEGKVWYKVIAEIARKEAYEH